MAPRDALGPRLLRARIEAAHLATGCVLRDGEIIYEDGEPKGDGVPERYSIDYERFVDVESLVDLFEDAPPDTKRRILKAAVAFVDDHPDRVEGFLPYLSYCLLMDARSVEFESTALAFIERYADHLRDADEALPEEVRRTVPLLATRLDGASTVPDHQRYGQALIHLERVSPGALAPYLDVFARPEHNRGERHIHVPSRPPQSIDENPDGAVRAFDRAVETLVDRRRGSYDERALANDVVTLTRLLEYASRSEAPGRVLTDRTLGLVRSALASVRDTAGAEVVRAAVADAYDQLDAVETELAAGD